MPEPSSFTRRWPPRCRWRWPSHRRSWARAACRDGWQGILVGLGQLPLARAGYPVLERHDDDERRILRDIQAGRAERGAK